MTRFATSTSRGGAGVGSILLLLLTILTSLNGVLFVLSTPVTGVVTGGNATTARRNVTGRLNVRTVEQATLNFVCKPRERAYHLMDLMQSYGLLNASEHVNAPAYIVLMRCDSHGGCCDSHVKTCMPVDGHTYFTEVQLRIANSINSRMTTKWFRVEQHGRCDCDVSEYASERAKLDAQKPIMESV